MSAVIKHSEERLLKVLLAPVISEKATFVAEKSEQVVFLVAPNATKPEIKAAVELMFKVQVDSVQTVNRQGKEKRSGRFMGRRNHTKRAFVCLKPGQEINFNEEAK
ncbi:MAG: 50S ribosomal protein L23 [Proteobacteria bacterium]|nr:50S ribosomal protein L23 [Pseudomonadota bacterium]